MNSANLVKRLNGRRCAVLDALDTFPQNRRKYLPPKTGPM